MLVREYDTGTPASNALGLSWENKTYNTYGLRFDSVSLLYEFGHTAPAYEHLRGSHDAAVFVPSAAYERDVELMQNITHLWEAHPEWGSTVLDWVQEKCKNAAGAYVGVPLTMHGLSLFYNHTRFEEWGITELPETWDDLLEICDDLMEAGHTQGCFRWSWYFPLYEPYFWFDLAQLVVNGADFYEAMMSGQQPFEDPRFSDGLRWLEMLQTEGYLKPTTDVEFGLGGFLRGEVPFMMHSAMVLGKLKEWGVMDNAHHHLRATRIPPLREGIPQAILMDTVYYGVPVNAPHPEAGMSYLEHMLSPEGQEAYFSLAGVGSLSGLYHDPDATLSVALDSLVKNAERVLDLSYIGFKLPLVSWALDDAMYGWEAAAIADDIYMFGDLGLTMEAARQNSLLVEVAPVIVDPPAGEFMDEVAIELSTTTIGASIHYTVDGTVPYTGSAVFSGAPIVFREPGTYLVRAVAVRQGLGQSEYHQSQFVVVATERPVSSSSSGVSGAVLGGVIGGSLALLLCVIVPVALVIYRKVQSRRISYTIGGDAPLMVDMADVEMVKSIGMGGFGEVWLGRWRGSQVAVKRLLAIEVTPDVVDAFVSEASMVMHLRHRNIITFMGVCTEPLSLITEFAQRGSLYDVLQNDNIHIEISLRIHWAREIAMGMAFLHSAKPPVLHRDFKSLNVLLDRNWVPKIADFGLSSFRESMESGKKKKKKKKKKKNKSKSNINNTQSIGTASIGTTTSVGTSSIGTLSASGGLTHTTTTGGLSMAQGSLYWTAPEVLANPAAFEARADVYAYGITLWEIFSRRELYDGENQFVVAWRVMQDNLRPPVGVLPPAADPIVPLMERCWATEAAQRPLFSEIAAEIDQSTYYNPDVTPLPAVSTEPQGEVVNATIVFPDIQEGVNECLELYCNGLRLAHTILSDCIEESGGYRWVNNVREVSIAFSSVARWTTFAERLADEFVNAAWDPLLAKTLSAGTEVNTRGIVVARGIRWTGAASISKPRIERNTATHMASYHDGLVEETRTLARTSGVPFRWAVEPGLAKQVARLPNTPLVVGPHIAKSGVGTWSLVDTGVVWDLGGRERLLCCHTEAEIHEFQESLSHSFASSSSLSSSSSSSSSRVRSASLAGADGQQEQQESDSGSSSSSSGSSSSGPPSTSASSASEAPEPVPAVTAGHGRAISPQPRTVDTSAVDTLIGQRRALREDAWLVWGEELETMWANLERFRVGTYTEALLGQWRGRRVLFKKLLRQAVPMDEYIAFLEQTAKARQYAHENLLPIVAVCICPPYRSIVVPYCAGGSLSDILGISLDSTAGAGVGAVSATSIALPLPARVRIAAQIAAGLSYLHSQGLPYGGIKPNNVLISDTHQVLLGDYGMEAQKNLGTMTQTASATYEAPECLRGEPKSFAADVFALGTLLFEVLTGTMVPRGRNAMESAFMILQGQMPAFPESMPKSHRAVVASCWRMNPAERAPLEKVQLLLNGL